jgi:hypothetical protein
MATEVSASVAYCGICRYLLKHWLRAVVSVLPGRASVRDELRDEKSFRRRPTEFCVTSFDTQVMLARWKLECARPLRKR